MKIFDAQQIRLADETTILRQGITSLDLMERAANEVFLWLNRQYPDRITLFHVFCGRGNNGGDGLVVARKLKEDGYRVYLDIIEEAGKPTPDFQANMERLDKMEWDYTAQEPYDSSKEKVVIIDALFGTGLSRDVTDEVKEVINKINHANAAVISIDVPSGLFMDRETNVAVQAHIVLTFQFPKLAFYMPSNKDFINDIVILGIGLDENYINQTSTGHYYTDDMAAHDRYKPVHRHAHKGTQGHALIIGGSYGKLGAVCLSAKAALKSGCGLVTAYIPRCGYTVLQTAFPEAMVLTDGEEYISAINYDIEPKTIGIGPGIGQHPDTQKALGDFLKINSTPLVIDADALNILSLHKEWLSLLPENTILTPHPKELQRLMGDWNNDFDKLEKMKAFSTVHKIILVAKDAYTMVVQGDSVYVNSTGNAGLATGGSGDVLTGIITGLLAQSYTPADAAIFGVYLHGLSADIGVKQTSKQAFTASDIISYTGDAYLKIDKEAPLK